MAARKAGKFGVLARHDRGSSAMLLVACPQLCFASHRRVHRSSPTACSSRPDASDVPPKATKSWSTLGVRGSSSTWWCGERCTGGGNERDQYLSVPGSLPYTQHRRTAQQGGNEVQACCTSGRESSVPTWTQSCWRWACKELHRRLLLPLLMPKSRPLPPPLLITPACCCRGATGAAAPINGPPAAAPAAAFMAPQGHPSAPT